MRRPRIVDFSRFILKYIFNWRFRIAEFTKKSKIYKKIIDFTLFKDDEIVVIPNTININAKIESEGSEFLPTEIIKEVIKRSDDIVIMNSCLCRTSNNCKDYPQDIGCIFLGPTAAKIPSHIGKIDTVWMNVHPGKGLLTICHCCPCCCLWKVYPNLDDEISEKLEKLDGVSVELHDENCKKCKKCLDDVCMFNAISFKNNKITIDRNICKGCGLCVNTCKFNAITINYTDETIDNVVNRIDDLIEIKEL